MKRICRYVDGQSVWEPPFTPEEEAEHRRRFDEMVQSGRGPTLVTDVAFLEGHCNGNQFAGQEHVGDRLKAEAVAAGQDVTGKVYLGGLANYPGDPEAWVSGRGDVQRLCEKRGWNSRGAVNYQAPEIDRPETPKPLVADDIVDAEVNRLLGTVDQPETVDRQDLKEQVLEQIAPPKHLR